MATPKTFLVGVTQPILMGGLADYLRETGQSEFIHSLTEATCGEQLCLVSFYAKLCYRSLVAGKNQNVSRIRDIEDNIKGVIASGHGSVFEHVWLNFITTNCSRVFTHELVRHRVGTAFCLAGDTVVWSGAKVNGEWDGVRKKWTIKQLYDWSQDRHRKGRLRLVTVRCLDQDRFVPAKIKTVIRSGVRDIWKVTLKSGRSIRCSIDHRFFSRDGWQPLRHLSAGNELATNGIRTGVASSPEKETARRRKIAESKIGTKNHQWRGDSVGKGGAYRRARAFTGDECEECGSTEQLHIHHKNRNILDNSRDNIRTLCNSCHGKLHHREDGNHNALFPKWDEIISIERDGREETYDLEVDHPAHNFVANGIVTHNSQTSGRYCTVEDAELVMPPELEDLPADDGPSIADEMREQLDHIKQNVARWRQALKLDDPATDFATKKRLTSALRRIMPNGATNEIGWSCNIRSLRHMIEMRTSRHAEWEIRQVFHDVACLIRERWPLMLHGGSCESVDGLDEWTGLKL